MDDTTTDTRTEEASPYMFDVSFDADQIARAEAKAKAKEQEPPEPTFTLLQVDEARKQGYDDGVLAGRKEASNGIENNVALALDRIALQLPAIVQTQSDANDQMMANAAEIAVTIMRKITPTFLERQGKAEIDSLLSQCVSNLIDEPKIRIRVAADLAAQIEERLEGLVSTSGFDGRFLVEPDETMQPTDCSIDWPGGGIEKRIDEIWAEIDTAVERFLAHYGQDATGPQPATGDLKPDTAPAPDASATTTPVDDGSQTLAEPVAHPEPQGAEPPANQSTSDEAGTDESATNEADDRQGGVSPPDEQTKAIDPEAPA